MQYVASAVVKKRTDPLQEYEQCYQLVKECIKYQTFPHEPRNVDNFRVLRPHPSLIPSNSYTGKIITAMLPLLMMRHRRIPRAKWKDCHNAQGKHWIEQSEEDIPPEKFNHSMIGYHLAISNSLCGMAMTQGERQKVVNIGLGIIQYTVEPRGTSVPTYIESMSHKASSLFALNTLPMPLAPPIPSQPRDSHFPLFGQVCG